MASFPTDIKHNTIETIYYTPPDPSILPPKNLFRGLSPYEPPVPSNAWLVVEPLLHAFNLYTPPDPTYGRYLLPCLPEEEYLSNHPLVKTTRRRIFINAAATGSNPAYPKSEAIHLLPEEVVPGKEFVHWLGWELEDRRGLVGEGIDVLVQHGIGDYSGRWSIHIAKFISNGFRIIAPDLPGHGRSTGLHCHIPNIDLLTDAMRLVLDDQAELDRTEGRPPAKKTFICGASLGGFTILKYLLSHPPNIDGNPAIEGCYLMCPLIDVSPASRPSKTIETVAKILEAVAGRVPVAQAQRGKGHADPRVELSFLINPQPYHGPLRISTGLVLMRGLIGLPTMAEKLPKLPSGFRVVHGKQDRVTDPGATVEFFERVKGARVEIWDGYEHVMNKVGYDAEDDEPRQKVLEDWYSWVVACL